MGTKLEKLLSIASDPLIARQPRDIDREVMMSYGPLGEQLLSLLAEKNGFYAFEGALHVFPASDESIPQNLLDWNQDRSWRSHYGGLTDGALFFGEDLFGGQFAIKDDGIQRFDPETGSFELMVSEFDEWAERILVDYEVETGYPLAHAWQQEHGRLPEGKRLVPTTPFVLGGDFELENLNVLDAGEGMKLRASVARQIADLPDGTKVQIVPKAR
jgi:hypothetical protein